MNSYQVYLNGKFLVAADEEDISEVALLYHKKTGK